MYKRIVYSTLGMKTYIDVYRIDGDQQTLLTQVDRNKNLNFNALVEMLVKTKGAIRGQVTEHYASRSNLLKHYDQDGNVIKIVKTEGIKMETTASHISIKVPDGKILYLGGRPPIGTYSPVVTVAGPCVRVYARVD